MTDDEKRAAAVNDLIGQVPMRVATEPEGGKTCVCCGAFATTGEPPHLIGCKYGPAPTPGLLTHRVECRACGSIGYLREGMPPFVHFPSCTGDGTLVGHQDRCGWVIGGAVSTAGTPCRELAVQVRFGKLLCATHSHLVDSVDAWSAKPAAKTFAEQVETAARVLAWDKLSELDKAVLRREAMRVVAKTPREQVKLPGVAPPTNKP